MPGNGHSEESSQGGEGAAGAGGTASGLPPASFSLLVATLAVQAQVHMGLHAHPGHGRLEKNLPAAKHAIDLIGILEAKTRSNLDPQEQALLGRALHDLRLAYVRAVRG